MSAWGVIHLWRLKWPLEELRSLVLECWLHFKSRLRLCWLQRSFVLFVWCLWYQISTLISTDKLWLQIFLFSFSYNLRNTEGQNVARCFSRSTDKTLWLFGPFSRLPMSFSGFSKRKHDLQFFVQVLRQSSQSKSYSWRRWPPSAAVLQSLRTNCTRNHMQIHQGGIWLVPNLF